MRATSPAEAFWNFDPFALVHPGDPWHCDLDQVFAADPRHYRFTTELTRRLSPPPERGFVHVGVVGHGGSGKTTQVRQVVARLADRGLEPVFVNALSYFDQGDLSFADVVLVLVSHVADVLAKANVEPPKKAYEAVQRWFAEELLTETQRRELIGVVETEMRASTGIPFLAKLMAKVSAALKVDNEYRKEIRRRTDRDPQVLVDRANDFLDLAHEALASNTGRGRRLIVIFDNLEKLADRAQVDRAVLSRSDELRRLRCNVVWFLSPMDQHAPITIQAGQAFDVATLPMLPLRDRGQSPEFTSESAVAAVRELLGRRAELERVFGDVDACVRELTRLSGGRVRDVFHLARYACEEADPARVSPEHIAAAAQRLRGERTSVAKPQHWARLAVIHRDNQVMNDPDDGYLLLHPLVLNYDGDPWWDVHPLVRLDVRFEDAWRRLSKLGA